MVRKLLDKKGRCCGRKPLVYKRDTPYKFCTRCDRAYDLKSNEQIENFAWRLVDGEFTNITGQGGCDCWKSSALEDKT